VEEEPAVVQRHAFADILAEELLTYVGCSEIVCSLVARMGEGVVAGDTNAIVGEERRWVGVEREEEAERDDMK